MFIFTQKTIARLHRSLCTPLIGELWSGFCCTRGELVAEPTDEFCFSIGTAPEVELAEARYAIAVSESGVLVRAYDGAGLMQGILALLRRIKPLELEDEPRFGIPCGTHIDKFDVAVRMAHICVFPETKLDFLQKVLRVCAALHYTHVILEPWGTLPFICMPELAWPGSPDREQWRALIAEARLLGMEPIPMLNHLGHASHSRMMSGKHVVLDQNPAKALYFSEDGWNWAIDNPRVRNLLRQVRAELYDIFGPGEYIHLGCDEAYIYGHNPDLAYNFSNYLCALTREVLEEEHRRPIIWGDMLLNNELVGTTPGDYSCNCKYPEIAEKIFSELDRRVVIADWHYRRVEAPFATTTYFASLGFDVLSCPWERVDNIRAAVDTARGQNTLGYMVTTWHTLNTQTGLSLLYAGAEYARPELAGKKMSMTLLSPSAAALTRKVCSFTDYTKCGWIAKQIKV